MLELGTWDLERNLQPRTLPATSRNWQRATCELSAGTRMKFRGESNLHSPSGTNPLWLGQNGNTRFLLKPPIKADMAGDEAFAFAEADEKW